jgi:hypothetical protein
LSLPIEATIPQTTCDLSKSNLWRMLVLQAILERAEKGTEAEVKVKRMQK